MSGPTPAHPDRSIPAERLPPDERSAGESGAGESGIGESGAGGRASDAIVRRLEAQILSGELPDHSPLPAERDLMARHGASRTVVREAVAALAHRGLVEHRPRFRPVVRKPGYDTALDAMSSVVRHLLGQRGGVRNLYESRVFVERALVREAAVGARREDIERLGEALVRNRDAIDDSAAFYATDTAFHGVLYRIPDNPIFPALHDAYTAWLQPQWSRMPRLPERNRVNYRSHKAIHDAVLARDPEAAEAALARHLNAAWEYVRATFDEEDA